MPSLKHHHQNKAFTSAQTMRFVLGGQTTNNAHPFRPTLSYPSCWQCRGILRRHIFGRSTLTQFYEVLDSPPQPMSLASILASSTTPVFSYYARLMIFQQLQHLKQLQIRCLISSMTSSPFPSSVLVLSPSSMVSTSPKRAPTLNSHVIHISHVSAKYTSTHGCAPIPSPTVPPLYLNMTRL